MYYYFFLLYLKLSFDIKTKITILTNNQTVLVFRYKAMSDGKEKTATFNKSGLMGYSLFNE